MKITDNIKFELQSRHLANIITLNTLSLLTCLNWKHYSKLIVLNILLLCDITVNIRKSDDVKQSLNEIIMHHSGGMLLCSTSFGGFNVFWCSTIAALKPWLGLRSQ